MKMKKRHWFSLGFPILTLFIYGIGALTSPHTFASDGGFVTSPNFALAILMFAMYGFIMFFWEMIDYLAGDNK
jgi:hypothetical protein